MSQLLEYWFTHETVWFGSTKQDDAEITQLFGHMLYRSFPTEQLTPTIALEQIVLYDQVARHVYRDPQDRHKIASCGHIALALSLKALENEWDANWSPAERCFFLLPLRHTFQPLWVKASLQKIRQYRQQADSKYYVRFYRAALLSLSKTESILPSLPDWTIPQEEINKVLDPRCLANTNIYSMQREKIYDAIETTYLKLNSKAVTISLSGGVDSMVASLVLKKLSQKYGFQLVAATVNYNNRDTADLETEFVTRWCQQIQIPHYVKTITEIRRDRSHDRDLYEKVTKQMRFDLYKSLQGNDHETYPVMLGHNQDDCLENIFSNIKKCKRYDNLNGMSEFARDSDCLLVRPMLTITKAEIRDFADRFRVPYLPNSTPSWCERGRLREQFIAFMEAFDPDMIPGFLQLAKNVGEVYTIYQDATVGDVCDQIEYLESSAIIRNTQRTEYIFWKDVLKTVFNKLGIGMVSNKSVRYLVDRIEKSNYGIIALSKKITVKYSKNCLNIVINNA